VHSDDIDPVILCKSQENKSLGLFTIRAFINDLLDKIAGKGTAIETMRNISFWKGTREDLRPCYVPRA
jgi:hypothetical protein